EHGEIGANAVPNVIGEARSGNEQILLNPRSEVDGGQCKQHDGRAQRDCARHATLCARRRRCTLVTFDPHARPSRVARLTMMPQSACTLSSCTLSSEFLPSWARTCGDAADNTNEAIVIAGGCELAVRDGGAGNSTRESERRADYRAR